MQLPPFKLERFFAKYEFKAPYLLCASDCESLTIEELLALEPEAIPAFQQQWLGYTESLGSPELRTEIAGLYEQVGPEQILVHTGAEEAIFNFMQVALKPGDHVIVHFPCYQSLLAVAQARGCEVTRWPARPEADWRLDLDFLADQIRPQTRAIIINCPHNPTGYLMSAADFGDLIEIARRHNLLLFSDEVYKGLEYRPADRLPAAADRYENAVSLGVMSKSYGLAGLRIGWIATRRADIYREMAAFKDYTTICNSAPSEFLATLALRQRDKILQRNLALVQANLARLDEFFARHADIFTWSPPKAGAIAFPGLKQTKDAEAFCLDLLDKTGVLLLPGTYYDFEGPHFRIGYGRRSAPEALARLEQYFG